MQNKKKKNILFVTSSRSDFATIERLLSLVQKDRDFNTTLFATGDHYNKEAGETYRTISKNGFRIDAKYRIKNTDPATQVGEVVNATASVLKKHRISFAVVCGDRKETFAAAVACTLENVPLFHIHGGDVTYGMIDDAMRHAITKLSAIHFPASPLSAKRVRQMGEEAWRIYMTGSPDTDGLHKKLPEQVTMKELGVVKKGYALMLLNPETLLGEKGNRDMAQAIGDALATGFAGKVVVLYPNNDSSADAIRSVYSTLNTKRFVSCKGGLPRHTYLALLKNAAFLVGNSSSGITEAASFKTPVINVGQRQSGREHNKNVINTPASAIQIEKAIRKVQSSSFVNSLKDMRNVYGNGGASERIYRAVKMVTKKYDTKELLYKKFQLV